MKLKQCTKNENFKLFSQKNFENGKYFGNIIYIILSIIPIGYMLMLKYSINNRRKFKLLRYKWLIYYTYTSIKENVK